MLTKFYRILLLIPSFLFVFGADPSAVSAQDSVSLTLSEALKTAADQNPSITAALYQVKAAESKIIQARSGFYPQVYITETFNRTTNPMWAFGAKLNQEVITQNDFVPASLNDPAPINNFATAVSADWSLYDGGRTGISLNQAKNQKDVTSLMLKLRRQEVIANTAVAYVGLLLAQKNIYVVEQAIETAKANLKMVRSRFESGFVVKSDLLRAQVRFSELEHQRLQAESRVKVAQAMLNAAMGIPVDQSINPTTPLERCCEIHGTLEEWIETALSTRPDLEQLRYHETITRQEIGKSRSDHLPSLNLFGNYEINSEDFSETGKNYNFGAVVRLNLFSGRRISGKTREAEASLQQIRAISENMELGIRVETQSAFLQALSAWKQIHVAKTAVNQAEESLRIVKNRYKNGLLTIVGLLDAEVALQQARIRHFRSMHDYKVSRIMLTKAAGTIDIDFQ